MSTPLGQVRVAFKEIPSFYRRTDVACLKSRYRDVPKSHELSAAFLPTAGLCKPSSFSLARLPASLEGQAHFYQCNINGGIAMHFALAGQYTPQALNSIMDNK